MSEYDRRQIDIIHLKLSGFRHGKLALPSLVNDIEALAGMLEDKNFGQELSDLAFELELVNSDVIEKGRALAQADRNNIDEVLRRIETLVGSHNPSNSAIDPGL